MKKLIYILTLCILFCFKSSEKDYEVKFGFIHKLTRFIKFPASSNNKFKYGTYQEDVFKEISQFSIDRKTKINNKELEFRIVKSLNNMNDLDLLFVPASYKHDLKEIIKTTKNTHTVVVSEQDYGAQKGAIINLIEYKGKFQFEINKSIGKQKGVEIHSKILKLAKKVY